MKQIWERAPQITIYNDPDTEPYPINKAIRMFWPEGEISSLLMDLEMEGIRIGNINLLAEGKNRYTEYHAQLMSLLKEPFTLAISKILQHQEILHLKEKLADDNRYLQQQLFEISGDTIIGEDGGLKTVMETVQHIAPLNNPILLSGETGVGKDIIANAIHHRSHRRNEPFIKVNCGAIPETLIDSELFGHEKGSFTGADTTKFGRFERAHKGTIFLDEIGELPLVAQVRLLRVIEHYEIERVGGTEYIPVDVRIISATNRNLEDMVKSGRFREDLWFRLNVFPIFIPPLRHRTQDIPALVRYFIERKVKELKIKKQPTLAYGDLDSLKDYHWPGNVRELQNLVERTLIQSQIKNAEDGLTFPWLLKDSHIVHDNVAAKKAPAFIPFDQMAENYIRQVLAHTNGKIKGKEGASEILGLHASTLRSKMRKLGIPHGKKH